MHAYEPYEIVQLNEIQKMKIVFYNFIVIFRSRNKMKYDQMSTQITVKKVMCDDDRTTAE